MSSKNICAKTNDTCKLDTYSDLFALDIRKNSHYWNLMNKTTCLVGNSSSGIREGAFIGTPCVNIGSRQNDRECGKNVIHTNNSKKNIFDAILKQKRRGKYRSEKTYGNGQAGRNIIKILNKIKVNIQKKITY